MFSRISNMKGNFIWILTGLTSIELLGLVSMFLMVTLVYSGTLTDNFDDGNSDGWRLFKGRTGFGVAIDDSAEWSVKDGELVCQSKGICQLASTFGIGDEKWKNYEFECEFKVEKITVLAGCNFPSFFGIGVHYNDKNGIITGTDIGAGSIGGGWNVNFCELFDQGAGIAPVGVVGGVPIEEGKYYKSRFVIKDNDYEGSVDGKPVCKFKNQLLNGGGVAFLGRNGKYHFDNVVITGDEIPDEDLGLPVEPKAKLATTWATIKQGD